METTEGGNGRQPTISSDGDDLLVTVEGETVVRVSQTLADDALLLWECMFWIFNLKTARKHSNLNWFLRENVFKNLKVDRTPSQGVVQSISSMRDGS